MYSFVFVYTSNKPVAMSAAELRDALNEKMAALDPQGNDLALQQMVVAGHSQGSLIALLAKDHNAEVKGAVPTGSGYRLARASPRQWPNTPS